MDRKSALLFVFSAGSGIAGWRKVIEPILFLFLWGAAVVLALIALLHWAGTSTLPALYWRWNWPWWGMVPLSRAAELAFKRLRGTDYAREALYKPTEEQRLDCMAEFVARASRGIYCRRPPEPLRPLARTVIDLSEIKGGGSRLHATNNPEPYVEDLHIRRADLWEALARLEKDAKRP